MPSVKKIKSKRSVNYNLRIKSDMFERIHRVFEQIKPRLRVLLGKDICLADFFRMLTDRGLRQVEKEFGIGDNVDRFILEDDLEDLEG